MVKKKIIKRRSVSTTQSNNETHQISDHAKHALATKAVQKLYDKNPDTSVYARRYQYKKQQATEDQ